ncbi:MAG: radical SAM protein [Candidatus Cloacimonetes bacterium]|nr:radical SAM protein [Candidatus Cloacimonadota bacterium]
MSRKHLFGPVPSRRLGLSLGVDLVPHKTCSLDCIYCESGATTRHTIVRDEYVPTDAVLAELEDYLRSSPPLDTVTFSGAGEPTLHRDIGRIIGFVKQRWPEYRLALITNGTLLHDAVLRASLAGLDLILPSLDAVSPEVFRRLNRPAPGLTVELLLDGLCAFRREHDIEMWLEVFLVAGVNDTEHELALLREAITRVAPHRVQLNTLDRPGAEDWVRPVSSERLQEIAQAWRPLQVEVIARSPEKTAGVSVADLDEAIVGMVERRPCTTADLAAGLGVPVATVERAVKILVRARRLEAVEGERGVFYRQRPQRR